MRLKLNLRGAGRMAAVCGALVIFTTLMMPKMASADVLPVLPIMRTAQDAGSAPATVNTDVSAVSTPSSAPAGPSNDAQPATAAPDSSLPLAGKHIGIQAGHWQEANMPAELSFLRTSTGGAGGGVKEADINLKIAQKVQSILQSEGATVDLLPATVPVKYTADAFVAIHCDATDSSAPRGYKVASSPASAVPNRDKALVKALYDEYGRTTGMPTNDAITNDMLYYYAFNNSRLQHTVASTTPAAIFEAGFLTNSADRSYLVNQTDEVAQGIAQGITDFLSAQ